MRFRRSPTASLPPPDILLLVLAGALLLFGFIALTSATGVVGYNKFGDSLFYIKRQLLLGFLPGVFLFFIAVYVPYTFWRRFAFPLFFGCIALLLLVLIPGIGASYGRARSWITIGSFFSFQPAEIAKVGMIFALAFFLENRDRFLALVLVLGPLLALVMLQPDVGTMGVLATIAVILYFVSGAPLRYLFFLALAGGGFFAALIAAAPYRLARVLIFLSPGQDPTGTGYQLFQSLVAIGSGGLFGVGLGASRQKLQYLPEVAADSIFSIVAEELGFLVVVAFLMILLALTYRGFRIARHAPDQFARLVTIGVFTWFFMQAFFNIASMVGLLPLTGVPLPFVSYGGTAMTMSLFALGIVANISRYSRHV